MTIFVKLVCQCHIVNKKGRGVMKMSENSLMQTVTTITAHPKEVNIDGESDRLSYLIQYILVYLHYSGTI